MGNRKIDLDLVKEFIATSKSDLDAAKNELKNKNFHNSVYHSQQCVEKICKALLIIHNKFVSVHIISSFFEEVMRKEKLSEDILIILKDLEKHWLMTRYPFRKGKEIWSPIKQYVKKDAEEALEKAKSVFERLLEFLKKKYKIQIE